MFLTPWLLMSALGALGALGAPAALALPPMVRVPGSEASAPAVAELPAPKEEPRGKKPESYFAAEYRFLTQGLTNLPVDELGTRLGQKLWAEQRLKVMGQYAIPEHYLRVELGAYLANGLLVGDVTSVGGDRLLFPLQHLDAFRRYEPRRAMLAWTTPIGELRIGHQTNSWGYGILANSGEQELDFDDARLGDLVERLAFITKPFAKGGSDFGRNFYTALAFDVVYRDTNANLIDGDTAINAVLSAFYANQTSFLGFFGTFRHQQDRNDDRINVGAFDVHGRTTFQVPDSDWSWSMGAEAVAIVGTTSRLRPDARPEGVDVLSGGGVARLSFDYKPWKPGLSRFGFVVEAGFASGDNDSNDSATRLHTFHSDYRVGMVLFPEVLAGLSARNADRAGDPARVGTAPSGTRSLPSNGSVQNAAYAWPRIYFRPLPNLTLRAGALYARSVADVTSPYLTFRAGGVNRNWFDGRADQHDLGWEVQLGARYTVEPAKNLFVHLGLEWGHLFPGAAFSDAAGNKMADVDRFIGRVALEWRTQ